MVARNHCAACHKGLFFIKPIDKPRLITDALDAQIRETFTASPTAHLRSLLFDDLPTVGIVTISARDSETRSCRD